MRNLLVLLLILLSPQIAAAQLTAPEMLANDSMARIRNLPASLKQELRISESRSRRPVIFRDTVRADVLARRAFNDSSVEDVTELTFFDSALSVVDSAVSLTHKEWLDSQVVEIPEVARFGDRVHFAYQPSVMVETHRRAVPFDSSLTAGMNPITRENLPFFDQSPIPLPLPGGRRTEGFVEAGAGNVYLPLIRGMISHAFNERFAMDGSMRFVNTGSGAIHHHYEVLMRATGQVGEEAAIKPFNSSAIDLTINMSGKEAEIALDSGGSVQRLARQLSLGSLALSWRGNTSEAFHYDLIGSMQALVDNTPHKISERNHNLFVDLKYDFPESRYRLASESRILHTGAEPLVANATGAFRSSDMNGYQTKLVFGRRADRTLEWFAGFSYSIGRDNGGTHNYFSPLARVRLELNPRWEIGGSYEQGIYASDHRLLANANPFYSPGVALGLVQEDSSISRSLRATVGDVRRMTSEMRTSAFMNYLLSVDDEIRTEIAFVQSSNELVFREVKQSGGQTGESEFARFVATPADVRRLTIGAHTNLLFFKNDVVTAGVDFNSATIVGEDAAVPFEPTLSFVAGYAFNSFSNFFLPSAELRHISRKDRSLSFLDVRARLELASDVTAQIRVENVLGSASDFWTGFNEYPRSIWATVRYRF